VYNFDQVWCSNSRDTFAYFDIFEKKKLTKWAHLPDYLRTYLTDLFALALKKGMQ